MNNQDPGGKDQHTSGAKLDAGKNMMGMVLGMFSKPIQLMCWVGTYGATKYTKGGWKDVDGARDRYMDALIRHLFAYLDGEVCDEETKLPHLAAVAWNALAILHFEMNNHDPEWFHIRIAACRDEIRKIKAKKSDHQDQP